MTEFGVKASLPGFGVETAADQDLYFSSSWPIMKIDENLSGSTTMDANNDPQVITHNLGYPPFTMVFSSALGYYGPANNSNSTTITVQTAPNDSLHYYIFRNPLNQNFQAPQLNLVTTPEGTGSQDFGLKFSKPGKDVSSTDLRDFTIHSGTRSLMVYQTVYQPVGPLTDQTYLGDIGYEYDTTLPYDPVYFAFYTADGQNFVPLTASAQTGPKIVFNSITGGIIALTGTAATNVAFYVMLDPYQTTNLVSVTL